MISFYSTAIKMCFETTGFQKELTNSRNFAHFDKKILDSFSYFCLNLTCS